MAGDAMTFWVTANSRLLEHESSRLSTVIALANGHRGKMFSGVTRCGVVCLEANYAYRRHRSTFSTFSHVPLSWKALNAVDSVSHNELVIKLQTYGIADDKILAPWPKQCTWIRRHSLIISATSHRAVLLTATASLQFTFLENISPYSLAPRDNFPHNSYAIVGCKTVEGRQRLDDGQQRRRWHSHQG